MKKKPLKPAVFLLGAILALGLFFVGVEKVWAGTCQCELVGGVCKPNPTYPCDPGETPDCSPPLMGSCPTCTCLTPTPPPPPPPPPGPTGEIPKLSELADLVKRLIQVLLALGGLAAFVYLLIGGFKYLTAEGDEKLLMGAKQTLTYAILGLIFVVASWLIINTVIQMIGPVEIEDVIIETPTFRIP